jgi:hypothetical protein
VCYRCRTSYHDLPIARYHRSWDRGVADRYPAPGAEADEPRRAEPSRARVPESGVVVAPPAIVVAGDLASASAGDVMETKSYFQ